jgi:hypothetical protein
MEKLLKEQVDEAKLSSGEQQQDNETQEKNEN